MRNKAGLSYKERLQQLELMEQEDYMIEQEESRPKKNCCRKACNKFITFLISRIGLFILVVLYVMIGGFVFEALEADNELKALKLSEARLELLLKQIYRQIENNSTRVKDDSFHAFLRHEVNAYREFITNSTINGTLTENTDPQWDFFGAVFYSFTLISTVGYGHITCKTKYGKAFTIIYSVVGIPLFTWFLCNAGSSSANFFKFIYLRFNSFKRRSTKRKISRLKQSISRGDFDNEMYEAENGNNEFISGSINTSIGRSASRKPTSFGKSFRFKSTSVDDKKSQKPLMVEAPPDVKSRTKRDEKKQERADILKKTTQQKEQSKESTKSDKEKQLDAKKPEVKKQEDPIEKVDVCNALKKLDNLIDGDNSICSYSDVNVAQRRESYNHNLKAVVEMDRESFRSHSTYNSDNEEDVFEDENEEECEAGKRSSLLPTLFEPKRKKTFSLQLEGHQSRKASSISNGSRLASIQKSSSFKDTTNDEKKSSSITTSTTGTGSVSGETKETTKPNETTSELAKKPSKKFKMFARSFSRMQIRKPVAGAEASVAETSATGKPAVTVASPSEVETAEKTSILNSIGEDDNPENNDDKFNDLPNIRPYARSVSHNPGNSRSVRRNSNSAHSQHKHLPYTSKQIQLLFQQYQQEREKKNGVPLWVVLIMLPAYLFIGMMFFSKVENWRKIDALYFCFITVTTIGFGDFIPGTSLLDKNGNKKNIYIAALYLIGGIILIIMIVSLLGKKCKIKIKRFARKIGLSNC